MVSLQSYLKGISRFNNIKFYDEAHAYFIENEQVLSVTGFIHRFENEFDLELQLDSYAKKHKRDKEEVRSEWDYKKNHALYEGNLIHKYLENLMSNKIAEDDKSGSVVTYDQVESTYKIMQGIAYGFYKDYIQSGKLIPVASELVIGSKEHMIAGQMDQLFFNTEVEKLQVWDWKTNGNLRDRNTFGNCKMLHCLSHLDACELNTYSLQLKSYRKLLIEGTGLDVHPDCYIVWINENNEKAHVIKCHDLDKEVNLMFDFKKQHPDMFRPRSFKKPDDPKICSPFDNIFSI